VKNYSGDFCPAQSWRSKLPTNTGEMYLTIDCMTIISVLI